MEIIGHKAQAQIGSAAAGTADAEVYRCKGCETSFAAAYQPSRCPNCNATGMARDFPTMETHNIAIQNDRFRLTLGMAPELCGKIVLTPGVNALMDVYGQEILLKLAQFSDFSDDNDPYGARDFGTTTVGHPAHTKRIFWKIDLYDVDYTSGSEAPSDPAQTRRVLTLLLPSEY